MPNPLNFDICVIGAGAAGLSIAAGASQLGVRVALIEAHKMGGDCLNYGCIPSKTLLAIAKHYDQANNSEKYGFNANPQPIQINNVMTKVKAAIKTIEPHDSIERFTNLGVTVMSGHAKFVSDKQIIVNETLINARYFIIATGSMPMIPPLKGLDTVKYLTNETIFDLMETPKHLLVLGGGPIGCEMAEAFAMLGIKVTLIVRKNILPKDDPELTSILRGQLLKHKITLLEQTSVNEIKYNLDGEIELSCSSSDNELLKINASHLLVATGRTPNINQLDLAKAKVISHEKGIIVDGRLRTSNKRIFAVGDVTGSFQFTHIAGYHAGIVIRNILFRQRAKVNYCAVPWVTYTTPELAHVGLSLAEAQKAYPNKIKLNEFAFENNDRAVTEQETVGKIKLITHSSGKVLGVSILGAHAGELITPWTDLINRGETVKQITKNIIPYPTLSDINKQVVGEYYKPILFTNKVKCLVKLLKILW